MRISTRGQYGLRAMCTLVLSSQEEPVALRDISRRENISLPYLEQIFTSLRRAGLVHSVRGVKGGYVLARRPHEITVGDILRAVEGPIAPVDCLREDRGDCDRREHCVSRGAWRALQKSMIDTLDSITLACLCLPKKTEW